MKEKKTLWVFDVDGVLTHPSEKRVTQPALFDEIIKRLQKGEPVALNTGRAMHYIEEQIITPLVQKITNTEILDYFLGVAEKGVIWEVCTNGKREIHIDPLYSVPQDIQQAVRTLVETSFTDVVFYDETKQTMATVEMNDGLAVTLFWERQKELDTAMQKIIDDHPLGDRYIVDPSRIATDIQAVGTGKHLGAKRILDWVANKEIVLDKVICFGDGRSDIAMAEEFAAEDMDTDFVYVGKKGDMDEFEGNDFRLIYTDADCEEGTLEYLTKQL